jgi:hypothetical protein
MREQAEQHSPLTEMARYCLFGRFGLRFTRRLKRDANDGSSFQARFVARKQTRCDESRDESATKARRIAQRKRDESRNESATYRAITTFPS